MSTRNLEVWSDVQGSDAELRAANNVGALDELLELGDALVGRTERGEAIEVAVARGSSTTVKVHAAEVEALTSAGSAAAGIRVVRDGRVGFASCGSHDMDVVSETLAEARDNCRFAEPDEHNGLAEPDHVEARFHDTWNDAVIATDTQRRIELALELESRVIGADDRVTSARTTTYGDGWGQSAIVTSAGIRLAAEDTSCSVASQPLARNGSETQIGWGYDTARDPEDLDLARVAAEALDRATKLLGATQPQSARMTILLEPRLSMTLLSMVAGMLSGDSVAKGRTPFADRLGEPIASPLVDLTDDPTRTESIGVEPFDGEGLACRPNPLIEDGVLGTFLHDSTSARRAGVISTASAVRSVRGIPSPGAQLLVMRRGGTPARDLLSGIELGLAVESFSGLHSGVNPVSGDFSVGANGLMIRNGQLAEPVQELTVASTLQRLLMDVTAVGDDFEWLPSGPGAASLRIDGVSISGS